MARNRAQFRKGISRMELARHLGIPYNGARRVKRKPIQPPIRSLRAHSPAWLRFFPDSTNTGKVAETWLGIGGN